MSLITDKFFWLALTRCPAVTDIVGDDIYNPYRPERKEIEDKVPYIIIQFIRLTNTDYTKDGMEGLTDDVTIHILCVASNRDELGALANAVRDAVDAASDGGVGDDECGFILTGMEFSAAEVIADVTKPCVFQTLVYNCHTERLD